MAANDYAVVVGIDRYPEIGDLEGAENDARAVIAWLEDPEGGEVPTDHIGSICSSDFDGDGEDGRYRPKTDDIYGLFESLMKLAREQRVEEPIGRRLYIFMAGHGVSSEPREATLLTANASWESMGHGVCGTAVADHLVKKGLFEEIVLLMDCCRNDLAFQQTLPWRYVEGATWSTRWVYGFATAARDRGAREREIDGEVRGVFTVALLRALRSGVQTSKTIEAVVAAGMREILGSDGVQAPHFQPGPGVVQLGAAVQRPRLRITCREHEPGETEAVRVEIGRGDGAPALHSRSMSPGETWEVELDRGLYEVARNRPSKSTIFKLAVKGQHVEI